jgi:hypothetical protein
VAILPEAAAAGLTQAQQGQAVLEAGAREQLEPQLQERQIRAAAVVAPVALRPFRLQVVQAL